MSHLELFLLGPFRASLDGEPITGFESNKVRALLAYLVVEAHASHPRGALAGLLWPEWPERSARKNLSNALSNLRIAIGDRGALSKRDASSSFLLVTRETIQVNPANGFWSDVKTFDEKTQIAPPDSSPADRLEEALALYRGEFLKGLSVDDSPAFEDWALRVRQRLHRQALDTLDALVDHFTRQGDYERACQAARRQVELEPSEEGAHRQLMRLYTWSGQRAAALRQYKECIKILKEELDVPATRETVELYERIREGRELPPAPGRRTEGGPLPEETPPQPVVPRHNLPAQLIPLVGRSRELAEILALLHDPDCRLLTLVGPGGSGKTRLAIEAAKRIVEDGSQNDLDRVCFVPLAPLSSPAEIASTVAQALDLPSMEGFAPREQVLNYLRERPVLLLLDNLEHLLSPLPGKRKGAKLSQAPGPQEAPGGASLIVHILESAPKVKVLATSRARLNVRGEQLLPVPGLAFPPFPPGPGRSSAEVSDWGSPGDGAEPDDILLGYSAGQFFLQSARRVSPDYQPEGDDLAQIAQICRIVGGMPLAILLAAAWMRLLSPAEILAAISDRLGPGLDLLATDWHGVPQRQRSLRSVFDHSYRLLTEPQQEVFRALSVFRGGFSRAAARQVAGATLWDLLALVDASLLQRRSPDQYELHELLREYAAEKLDQSPDAARAARERHSAYYVAALEQWAEDQKGARQQIALTEIETDIENVRAARDWVVTQGRVERLDQAMEGLGLFYIWRERYQEAESTFRALVPPPELEEEALAAAPVERLQAWAKALAWQSWFGARLGHADLARKCLARGLDLLDHPSLIDQDTRRERAYLLWVLGQVATWSGDQGEAIGPYEQSLALYRALDDRRGMADALHELGVTIESMGDFDRAIQLQKETLSIRRELGDPSGTIRTLQMLGLARLAQGHFEEAECLLREAIALARETGDRLSLAWVPMRLADIFTWQGKLAEGLSIEEECQALFDDLGVTWGQAHIKGRLGLTKGLMGHYQVGSRLIEQALTYAWEMGDKSMIGANLRRQGLIALAEGEVVKAQRCLQESADLFRAGGDSRALSRSLALLGCAAAKLGRHGQAREQLHEALGIAVDIREGIAPMFVLPVAAVLLADLGCVERAVEIYALARRFPFVANARLWENLAGQRISALALTLPPDVAASAKARGRARDLWATMEELLAEWVGVDDKGTAWQFDSQRSASDLGREI